MISSATLAEAIETYNEYRSPMATAELVASSGDGFVVRFEGPFCRTCCDYDYFEDLVYELRELDVDSPVAVSEIDYEGDESFAVEFSVGPR